LTYFAGISRASWRSATHAGRDDVRRRRPPCRSGKKEIGKALGSLPTRPLLPQDDGAALVEANRMEGTLPISIPITATLDDAPLVMDVLLNKRPSSSVRHWRGRNTAGPSH
jgi:hypothetical protein